MKIEIEEKGVIPDSQAGFRKERGTMDNVGIHPGSSIMNWRRKGEGCMHCLCGVWQGRQRENVYERERERGISKWLVRKIEEIYARTKNKVKVEEKEGWKWQSEWYRAARLAPCYLRHVGQM
jgi:hypothetical protein